VDHWPVARRLPQTRYARSSGAKIAYQVSGTGPPDLVMVPGLVSHLDIQWQQTGYRRFVRALEQGGRVIRLDKRGTGLPDPTTELPTTAERVQGVAAVMAAAKSSRSACLTAAGRLLRLPRPILAGRWAWSCTVPRTGAPGLRFCSGTGRWCAIGAKGGWLTW
jgi:pimeloyl-ACP methyl ester carboxylesterase